jgi:hypothetical protein
MFEVGGDSLPVGLYLVYVFVAKLYYYVHDFSHIAEVAVDLYPDENSHCDEYYC